MGSQELLLALGNSRTSKNSQNKQNACSHTQSVTESYVLPHFDGFPYVNDIGAV